MRYRIPRAETAETAGVSSVAVQNMLDEMQASDVDIHSIMVLRNGKVACEAWQSPLTPDDAHMVYSVSKSFLSVAYGFALEEGYITKDTLFLDVFPEYKKSADRYLKKLKLFDLLGMQSGKRTARGKSDWLDSFVKAKWDFAPGEEWRYVSDNYYAASAALTKLLGMPVTEYLTPRLFEPLGIEVPFWEKSPQGIEAGGWGLFLKTEDIAKFILCCHNGGVIDGKQIIPKNWLKIATSNLFDTSQSQKESDCKAGYGYGFWQCALSENMFRCEGMYSQYAISFKDYDACIVMTSGCANLQLPLDIIWKYAADIFSCENCIDGIKIRIEDDKPFDASMRSPTEKLISGKKYGLRKKLFINACGYPISTIPMPALFFAKDKGGDITDLVFDFDENGFNMTWTENGNFRNCHYVPLDGTFASGNIRIGDINFSTVATARWSDECTLEVVIRPLSAVAKRRLVFKFNGGKISMYPSMIPGMDERAKVVGEKLKCVLKGRYFEWWIDILIPRVRNILEPVHHGRIKQ